MISRIRIQCINKTDRQNPHERVKNVGGVTPDGSRWKQSVNATIKEIENGVWEFYVEEEHKANVIVAVHNGHKYIKTDHVALADKALCDTDVFAVVMSGDEVAADRVAVFEPERAARDHLFLNA
ncbi:DUF3892 domain-containing protein [Bradyrhizobium sp. CB1015]|uniref:DUF3892 domain-containing protein n=1 Tax=Bradyrhizobium sp. CB1015 TaxID=2976822 RepID=UPI0021AA47C9|nr:DUF3892 domain-containing protein [Bradyrhizobium sp. CB1015]UWU93628.1 DUF3892 domain-containing protein [Bradyrhizobium sp. CB1015]